MLAAWQKALGCVPESGSNTAGFVLGTFEKLNMVVFDYHGSGVAHKFLLTLWEGAFLFIHLKITLFIIEYIYTLTMFIGNIQYEAVAAGLQFYDDNEDKRNSTHLLQMR